jgi:hypothetical protein
MWSVLQRKPRARYLEPLLATPQATRNPERWLTAWQDCSQTVEIEPLLRQLQAPTPIHVGDRRRFLPGDMGPIGSRTGDCRRADGDPIELEGARILFPEEGPDALADALREHWRGSELARIGDAFIGSHAAMERKSCAMRLEHSFW